MARVALRDERGVVYVEFLIAFIPLFFMFLAICQLALLAAAEAVVRHAAYSAVRSAVVVLEDSPKKFDNAPRGSLGKGDPDKVNGLEELVQVLGFGTSSGIKESGRVTLAKVISAIRSGDMLPVLQAGARMVPIRTAAYLPLIPLAPNEGVSPPNNDSVARALATASGSQLNYAIEYTKAATAITLHDRADDIALAKDPIDMDARVSARVSYAYHCTIPVVRTLMCRSIARLAETNPLMRHAAKAIPGVLGDAARFKLLTAVATLPNQGASYDPRDEK